MDFDQRPQTSNSSTAASQSAPPAATAGVPGKQVGTDYASGPSQLLAQVIAHAGTKLDGGGGFSYVVTDKGNFKITKAPAELEKRTLGHEIEPVGKMAGAWRSLAQDVVKNDPKPAPAKTEAPATPAPAAPEPGLLDRLSQKFIDLVGSVGDLFGGSKTKPPEDIKAQVDANATGAGGDMCIGKPDVGNAADTSSGDGSWLAADKAVASNAPQGPFAPRDAATPRAKAANVVLGTTMWNMDADARIRDDAGKETGDVVPQYSYVKIIAVKDNLVQVELLGTRIAPTSGTIVWTSAGNFIPLARPNPRLAAGAQMQKLLSAAKGGGETYKCYASMKRYIKEAGGYGDILDIYNDERFDGDPVPAKNFHYVIQRNGGPAAFGLEQVSGDPRSQAPGTLLITIGTGPKKAGGNDISEAYGDIAVIGEKLPGILRCYNFGTMDIPDVNWEGRGSEGEKGYEPARWKGSVLAMYKPIDPK